ncbi:MAG: chromophore lyase CpcT/CpeT [Phycisphaeraceae bacterium]|nr:chromophore lyase CpcT/CpeT [Phycisphaeraceae bacterium]
MRSIEVTQLRDYLSGSFASAEQAEADPDFADIRLKVVQVWPERADGPWLYVEQAAASTLDRPYRQRVYRLIKTGANTFVSEVYTLPEPEAQWAGAWADDRPLASLSPARLSLKDGCGVALTYHYCSSMFDGGTRGTACGSSLRGAAYATSEVTIWEDLMISWDRGYNEGGEQVWGSTKGGYRFKKVSPDVRMDLRAGTIVN